VSISPHPLRRLRERFAALREKFPNWGAALNRNKCLALARPLLYALLRGVALRELAEMRGTGPLMTTRIDRDVSLVTALRRGDPTAAEDLVAVYGDRACLLATRITRNAQDAEKAVQDAFLSVIRKIDSFRGEAAFGSWVCRIVANAAYQCCRKPRRREADVSLVREDDLARVCGGSRKWNCRAEAGGPDARPRSPRRYDVMKPPRASISAPAVSGRRRR